MSLLDTLKTPSEDEVLTATQKARMALLENMTKDGIPECNRDRRVMLELLLQH